MSNLRYATESRISSGKNSKKTKLLLVKLKGMGCKGTTVPVSTPAIIRSAAQWKAEDARNQKKKKREPMNNRGNLDNVVVDVPNVCCTPPGIGIASDFATVTRNTAPRFDHRKHSREARRNRDDSGANFPAILSGVIGTRNNHRSAEEIIEMLMSRQTLLPERTLRRDDQHLGWRLDIDDMSYEELLELSERIGYVSTGLQEEEISNCLRKLKSFSHDSGSLLATGHKDWKCSICQEIYRRGDDIGTLECGHHHHVECIEQWLLHKNACPLCKSAAL